MSFRPRTAANVAAIALVGLVGVTGCQSQPGHRRVVLDLIEAQPNLTAAQRECMTDALGSFTSDQLDDIAQDNKALDFSQDDFVGTGSDLYGEFVETMNACYDGGTTATTEPTGTTDVTDTTDGDSADTTEAADATEGSATTDATETTEA